MSGDDGFNRPGPDAGPDAGLSVDHLAAHADQLLDRRRVPQARATIAEGLRLQPAHTGLLMQLARAEVIEQHWDAAREVAGRVMALSPGHAGARFMLFLAEMESGHLPAAELLILDLLREAPQTGLWYAQYARLMLRALLFDKASRLADEALRFAPNDANCLRTRVLCDLVLQGNKVDSAALQRLVVDDPHDLHTMRLVAVALVHAGRTAEAHQLAKTLLRADPTDKSLLEMVQALRTATHWSMLPLYPLQRWGWGGSIGLWLVMLVVLRGLDRVAPQWAGPATGLLLAYVAYSWIWPPIFRRWVQRA